MFAQQDASSTAWAVGQMWRTHAISCLALAWNEIMNTVDPVCKWKFVAIPDHFYDYQAAARVDSNFRARTLPSLGLLEEQFTNVTDVEENCKPWEHFLAHVDRLNQDSFDKADYKIVYITRHGLGYHNVFEAQVGHDAWNQKWSHMDGDGTVVWADSELNENGIEQAKRLGDFWKRSLIEDHVPAPQTFYTSPLARCLETTRLAFTAMMASSGQPFRPIIKENLRERVTDHTCDRRRSRSWITEHYPTYEIEPGFAERDILWSGTHWESDVDHQARVQDLLEDIFNHDPSSVISLTTHSYAISAFLKVLALNHFRVAEGSSIALLVKGERL